MPLPKRCVEPVHVSRGTVPERLAVPSELEAVTNGTLANTVRQLSSLSKHAEDMFGELTREATNLAERTNVLQARIDRLAIKVTQLDSGVEEVSLQDIQMRKAFRSSRTFQQQLFSRTTIPSAMLATYARCDRPPPLERLNEFRDDGRDARKFYTDPDYFFELWRREMLQDTERIQHDRGKKVRQPRTGGAEGRGTRRVRVPHSTRDRQKAEVVNRGEHIMAPTQLRRYNIEPQYRPEPLYQATTVTDGGYRTPQTRAPSTQPARPNSIEIENQQNRTQRLTGNGHVVNEESPYGPVESIYGGSIAGTPRRARPSIPPPAPPAPIHNESLTPTRSSLPPPPPPPDSASPPPVNGTSPPHRTALDAHLDHMHAVIGMMSSEESPARAPTPPPVPLAPPAPPPPAANEDRPRPPSPATLLRGASALKPPTLDHHPAADPRSDLLKAIREGIKLRKVEKRCEDNVGKYDTLRGAPALHDVASILARRVAVEQSDSDEEDDSDLDDDEWADYKPQPAEDKVVNDFETQKIQVEVKCDSDIPKINSFKNDVSEKVKEASPRNEVAVPIRKSSLKKVPPPIKCDDSPPQEPLPSPPKCATPPKVEQKVNIINSPTVKEIAKNYSPPKATSPPVNREILSPPIKNNVASPPWGKVSPFRKEINSPSPVSYTSSPPSTILKTLKSDIHIEENVVPPKVKRDSVTAKDIPKTDKLSLPNNITEAVTSSDCSNKIEDMNGDKTKNEESNGVGDKIKIFEKAAEEAGKLSRPGSVRGRPRVDRLGSDSKEDLPPPATPFKDNIFFDLGHTEKTNDVLEKHDLQSIPKLERQQSVKSSANIATNKWQRNSNSLEEKIQKPEPQKIIKPEFKPMSSPIDLTIRSPSIVGKIPEQFPSHGTAFRNVASPDTSRTKPPEDQFKTCKVKNKEKYSVSKGSSYFTRGSEEIWLVKKKDIEEIEERVLDSFRRAGNFCNRSESMRPSSDGGQSFPHATMGRTKRQMYARSESLDPQWAGNRSQTLKRQTSVACTCGHDKKARSKSAGSDTTARQRSKSHGDDNQSHVLDKYETLV
ncbi:unnamed protein product [Leptosia nina]|uniref:Wiskott-Aldrich syndrome protein family member n=1 Tax=Leptosia nina TaxID=320188 RepID=A0AAV1K424_9NEOP